MTAMHSAQSTIEFAISILIFSVFCAKADGTDVTHVNELNFRFADCHYHDDYHMIKTNTCYAKALIVCQASGTTIITYVSKMPCT